MVRHPRPDREEVESGRRGGHDVKVRSGCNRSSFPAKKFVGARSVGRCGRGFDGRQPGRAPSTLSASRGAAGAPHTQAEPECLQVTANCA